MTKYADVAFGTVMDSAPIAVTSHGKVMGECREGVAIFRGIPYGGNCDAERRFLPPVPAENWEGIRDCRENGPVAVQERGSIQRWEDQGPAFHGGKKELFKVDNEVQGENCLVANVLTPGLDDRKRPVLFYIHGGGFSVGSGALVLGGDKVCREEDIVLVSVNHRLGPFGYLYLGDLDPKYELSGIAGILDLVLALRWAKENVANFGGDPDNITVLGESGGGGKISMLLSMAETEGLFRGAVLESGAVPNVYNSKEIGTQIAKESLKILGVEETNLAGLQNIPTEKIQELCKHFPTMGYGFVPTADGNRLPFHKQDDYIMAPWASKLNIIVGSSEEERGNASRMEDLRMTEETLRQKLLQPVTAPGAGEKPFLPCTEGNVDAVIAYLKATAKQTDDYNQMYHKVLSMYMLGGTAVKQADCYLRDGCKTLYTYFVKYDSHHPEFPEIKIAWHTATLPLQMRVVLHQEDEKLSRAFCHSIAAFARTGNPNTEDFHWDYYTKDNRETLVIDEDYQMQDDPMRPLRELLGISG